MTKTLKMFQKRQTKLPSKNANVPKRSFSKPVFAKIGLHQSSLHHCVRQNILQRKKSTHTHRRAEGEGGVERFQGKMRKMLLLFATANSN